MNKCLVAKLKCVEEFGPGPGHHNTGKLSTQLFRDVRGYHVYKHVWKPAIGKIFHAEQELDNAVDKFAVKVVKNNETVGHLPREYSQILWYFIASAWK